MPTTYVCENGHELEKHKSQPHGHGQKPVCINCGADIVERVVPIRECNVCEFRWAYGGSSDRPTCPECKSKDTRAINAD